MVLKNFNNDNYNWGIDGLEKCINENKLESKIIAKNLYAAIVHVVSYKDSQVLGAMTNWCISEHLSSWEKYVENDNNYQVFIYDFSRNLTDQHSIIGATYKLNKAAPKVICSFTKVDNPLHSVNQCVDDDFAIKNYVLRFLFGKKFNIKDAIKNNEEKKEQKVTTVEIPMETVKKDYVPCLSFNEYEDLYYFNNMYDLL